jgi:hypothetical protein
MNDISDTPGVLDELNRQSRELKTIRELLSKVINYMIEAETEVSEKMRRFIMYMHDLHDVCYMYESRGQPAPEHVRNEMERCDDRYRQLLLEAHSDGGTFEKVRREMAKDPHNRWDHTRLLNKPQEKKQ